MAMTAVLPTTAPAIQALDSFFSGTGVAEGVWDGWLVWDATLGDVEPGLAVEVAVGVVVISLEEEDEDEKKSEEKASASADGSSM